MDITRENFNRNLEYILNSVETADFIGVDAEFTGFTSHLNHRYCFYDSLDDRYLKMKENTNTFWVCQIGLSTFKHDPDTDQHWARPFNIYMLPSSPNRTFGIQYSNMEFLVDNEFDFNKLFKVGVPTTRVSELELNMRSSSQTESSSKLSSLSNSAIQESFQKIKDFIDAPEKVLAIKLPNESVKKTFYSKSGVTNKFQNLSFNAQYRNGEIMIEVRKTKKPPRCLQAEPSQSSKQQLIEQTLGITKIFLAIIENKVPLIGHNCLLDIAYFYNHFIDELPPTLTDFKQQLVDRFPIVVDTKYVADTLMSDVINRTSLEEMFKKYTTKAENPIEIKMAEHFSRYQKSDRNHEAGFDAYMTGVVFVNMKKYLLETGVVPSAQELYEMCACRIRIVNHFSQFVNLREIDEKVAVPPNLILVESSVLKVTEDVAIDMSAFGDVSVFQSSQFKFILKYGQGLSVDELVARINDLNEYSAIIYN